MYTETRRGLLSRMIRAARLDARLYEEVERDRNATGQAAQIVIMVAIAGAIGALLSGSIWGAVVTIPATFLTWVMWGFLSYWIATSFFSHPQMRTSPGEMLRTIGFAQTPGVLLFLTFIPGLGALVGLVAGIWQFIGAVIGVRAAMDSSTGPAVATVLIGAVITIAVNIAIGIIL